MGLIFLINQSVQYSISGTPYLGYRLSVKPPMDAYVHKRQDPTIPPKIPDVPQRAGAAW